MLAKPASSTQELKLAKATRYSACHSWMLHSAALLWRPKWVNWIQLATGHSEFLWVSELQTWDIWVVTASHHLPSAIVPSTTSKMTKHQRKRQTKVRNEKKLWENSLKENEYITFKYLYVLVGSDYGSIPNWRTLSCMSRLLPTGESLNAAMLKDRETNWLNFELLRGAPFLGTKADEVSL